MWNKDDALTVEIKSHGELTLAINNVVHPDFTITNVFELLKCSKAFPIICTSQLLDFSSFITMDKQNVELDSVNIAENEDDPIRFAGVPRPEICREEERERHALTHPGLRTEFLLRVFNLLF